MLGYITSHKKHVSEEARAVGSKLMVGLCSKPIYTGSNRIHSDEVTELLKNKEGDDGVRSYPHPVRNESLVESQRSL